MIQSGCALHELPKIDVVSIAVRSEGFGRILTSILPVPGLTRQVRSGGPVVGAAAVGSLHSDWRTKLSTVNT